SRIAIGPLLNLNATDTPARKPLSNNARCGRSLRGRCASQGWKASATDQSSGIAALRSLAVESKNESTTPLMKASATANQRIVRSNHEDPGMHVLARSHIAGTAITWI